MENISSAVLTGAIDLGDIQVMFLGYYACNAGLIYILTELCDLYMNMNMYMNMLSAWNSRLQLLFIMALYLHVYEYGYRYVYVYVYGLYVSLYICIMK